MAAGEAYFQHLMGAHKVEWIILVLIVLMVFFFIAIQPRDESKGDVEYPYRIKPELFSPTERSFLGALDQAVGDRYRVFGKVRVADVVRVKSISDRRIRMSAFNRISSKHFDFIFCRKDDLKVVGALELDDKSRQKKKRQRQDAFMVALCSTISLPLIQLPEKQVYSVPEIRTKVLGVLDQAIAEDNPPLSAHKKNLASTLSDAIPISVNNINAS